MRRFLAEYRRTFPRVWRSYYGRYSMWLILAGTIVLVLLLDWANIWPS